MSSDVLTYTKRLILGGFNYINSVEILQHSSFSSAAAGFSLLFQLFSPGTAVPLLAHMAWSLWHPGSSSLLLQQQASAGRRLSGKQYHACLLWSCRN